jgi:hypothetical protein
MIGEQTCIPEVFDSNLSRGNDYLDSGFYGFP